MKKFLFLLTLTIITVCGFSQTINREVPNVKIDYPQKSKHQKTAAWILLGGGFALSTTCLFVATTKVTVDIINTYGGVITGSPASQHNYTTESILLVSGTVAMLSSIPLFIAASKNKKKGIILSLKNEMLPQIQNSSFIYQPYPAVSFKTPLK